MHFEGRGGTVMIAFKDGPKSQFLEAWRIMSAVAGNRANTPWKLDE